MKIPLFVFEKIKQSQAKLVSFELAEIISIIFDPFIVTMVILGVVLSFSQASLVAKIGWSLLFILVSITPTVVYILRGMRTGKIHDWFISERKERYKVLAVALVSIVVLNILLVILKAPLLLLVFSQTAFFQAMILSLITLYWKVSFHTSFFAFLASTLVILSGRDLWFVFLFLPLIAWSRHKLGKHSWGQLLIGALVSIIVTYLVFRAHGLV